MCDSPTREKLNQVTAKPLSCSQSQKTCWREEYIRILEWLEYPPPLRHEFPMAKDDDVNKRAILLELMSELESAGFIRSACFGGVRIPSDKNITYSGRLELEKLKSMRPLPKFRSKFHEIVIFVLGGLFTAVLPLFLNLLATHLQK